MTRLILSLLLLFFSSSTMARYNEDGSSREIPAEEISSLQPIEPTSVLSPEELQEIDTQALDELEPLEMIEMVEGEDDTETEKAEKAEYNKKVRDYNKSLKEGEPLEQADLLPLEPFTEEITSLQELSPSQLSAPDSIRPNFLPTPLPISPLRNYSDYRPSGLFDTYISSTTITTKSTTITNSQSNYSNTSAPRTLSNANTKFKPQASAPSPTRTKRSALAKRNTQWVKPISTPSEKEKRAISKRETEKVREIAKRWIPKDPVKELKEKLQNMKTFPEKRSKASYSAQTVVTPPAIPPKKPTVFTASPSANAGGSGLSFSLGSPSRVGEVFNGIEAPFKFKTTLRFKKLRGGDVSEAKKRPDQKTVTISTEPAFEEIEANSLVDDSDGETITAELETKALERVQKTLSSETEKTETSASSPSRALPPRPIMASSYLPRLVETNGQAKEEPDTLQLMMLAFLLGMLLMVIVRRLWIVIRGK